MLCCTYACVSHAHPEPTEARRGRLIPLGNVITESCKSQCEYRGLNLFHLKTAASAMSEPSFQALHCFFSVYLKNSKYTYDR